jgi:hypothetical protein
MIKSHFPRARPSLLVATLLLIMSAVAPAAALDPPKRFYEHVVPSSPQPSEPNSLPDPGSIDVRTDTGSVALPREPETLRVEPQPQPLQSQQRR